MTDRQDSWKVFEGKKVFIILNNNNQYNGEITLIENSGNGLIFIHLTDKFGKNVIFTSGEIKLIQEKE